MNHEQANEPMTIELCEPTEQERVEITALYRELPGVKELEWERQERRWLSTGGVEVYWILHIYNAVEMPEDAVDKAIEIEIDYAHSHGVSFSIRLQGGWRGTRKTTLHSR